LQTSLNNNRYTSVKKFIQDVAQITYNARLFNRKDSDIYSDALTVDNYLKESIEKLRALGQFTKEDLEYPDLGPLPEGSEGEEEEEEEQAEEEEDDDEEDEEEDEEEEEDEDDDDEDRRRSSSKRGRPPRVVRAYKKQKKEPKTAAETIQSLEDKRKKRGRPPTVDKPHEHRIKAILRGVRKTKEPETMRLLYPAFEKLPDPKLYPQYYQEVQTPMALDTIRKNIKRRKYQSVDAFIADMNIMFDNAKMLNPEGTQIYKDTLALQKTMVRITQDELAKPDSVYQDPDSSSKVARLPLDNVEHNGEIYRVGDWVHIKNGNEGQKPTVGQIFRIWQSADGQRWVNACWYYRPEQTVHRFDKLFFENEVVKSGQYRDHLVDEIIEKCYVMFFTRYQRGRPKGIGNKSVYCCESRYNEHEKTFNKIRTWKACIPDEVRSTDYAMDLFERQRPLRRVISPIKHLLPANAKEDDPKPEPKIGVANAPPIVGGVYKRPYDPENPPEEPTPEYPDEPAPVLLRNTDATSNNLSASASPVPSMRGSVSQFSASPQSTTPTFINTTPAMTANGHRPGVRLPKNGTLMMPHRYVPQQPQQHQFQQQIILSAQPQPPQQHQQQSAYLGPPPPTQVPVVPIHPTMPGAAAAAATVMAGSPYAPTPVPYQMPNPAGYAPVPIQGSVGSQPVSFTLPQAVDAQLRPALAADSSIGQVRVLVNRADTGLPEMAKLVSWFPAPPVWVTRRHVSEPVPRHVKLRFGDKANPEGDLDEKVSSSAASLGHSAKYLVWKRQKLSKKQETAV
jgi:chromatin structure-remodeling complex subunit RSC1/2